MQGRKKIEFRKRPLAKDVDLVWVYATAPVQLIVGYFKVGATVNAAPLSLWRRFNRVGCIDRVDFDRYYANSLMGSGIRIENATRLAVPMSIGELYLLACHLKASHMLARSTSCANTGMHRVSLQEHPETERITTRRMAIS